MAESIFRRARRRLECRLHLDRAPLDECIVVNGLGRSGTTWLGGLLQEFGGCRSLFEPFFPRYVPASEPLGYFPYLRAGDGSEPQVGAARRIVSGRIGGRWPDRDNRPGIYRDRLIKEIRASYMLPWLKGLFPKLRIVLMVRDPVAVYESWKSLGWIGDQARAEEIFGLYRLARCAGFDRQYPEWANHARGVFPSVEERAFCFDWFSAALVPLIELDERDYYLVGYEEVAADPAGILGGLFDWLNLPHPDADRLRAAATRSSSTHFRRKEARIQVAEAGKPQRALRDALEEASSIFAGCCYTELDGSLPGKLLDRARVIRAKRNRS